MHRQTTTPREQVPGRARPLVRRLERRGVAATYALHDRDLSPTGTPAPLRSRARPLYDEAQRNLVARLDADGLRPRPILGSARRRPAGRPPSEIQGDAFIAGTEQALAAEQAGEESDLRRRAGKEFVIRANSFEGDGLAAGDAWARACLSERMLDLANAYLRMWASSLRRPLVHGAAAAGERPSGLAALAPRLRRQAPAQGVPLPRRRGRRRRAVRVRARQPAARPLRRRLALVAACTGRIPDEEVRRHVADGGVKTFTAPRGTSSSATRADSTAAASAPRSRACSPPRRTARPHRCTRSAGGTTCRTGSSVDAARALRRRV